MLIEQKPTIRLGLKYEPSFVDTQFNYRDSCVEYDHYVQSLQPDKPLYHGPIDFTTENQSILAQVLKHYQPLSIVEIGVCRDNINSSTLVIRDNKLGACTYLGIDLRDLSHMNDPHNGIYMLQIDSRNIEVIKSKLSELNIDTIDLLVIDGDHSINGVLNDFKFADLVSIGGIIVMHDINHHPGPREVFKAADETYYQKAAFCADDYGLGILRKIK